MTVENFETLDQENVPVALSQEEGVVDDDMQKPVFNKRQVSDVVKREREKAYEKGKREAIMQLQQEQQQSMQQPEQSAPMQQPQNNVGLGGMAPQLTQADIQKMIADGLAEKAPQLLQEHVNSLKNEHVVNSFVSKMQAAEQKYPGLEEQLSKLDYVTLAPVVQMANEMENTADIMKELIDNPMKMGNLLSLTYAQPSLAHKAIMDLSNSIKQNQEAKSQEAQARDPMSQLKPSSNAGMDSGSMSVKDFRKMFKL